MENKTQEYYKALLKHMEYYNLMAPFPVYDTELVSDLKKKIMKITQEEYNKMPVVACKYCKSLHVITDELENDICFRCGSLNSTREFKTIDEYLIFKNE